MKLSDLPYPHRLCAELIHHAIFTCEKTKDMKCGDVVAAVSVFFDAKVVDDCFDLLSGKAPTDGPLASNSSISRNERPITGAQGDIPAAGGVTTATGGENMAGGRDRGMGKGDNA